MSSGGTSSFLGYQVALIVILILVGLNLAANLRMLRRAAPRGAGVPIPQSVSVLVPARNEARNIGRCLRSLLAQDYPLLEILVLDDGSTDSTPEIVAEMAQANSRLRLLRGRALPQGWMGKNYACHQLAQVAQGEWLLFTDADTHHRPGALVWAIEAAQQNEADLVSLIPHIATHSLGEDLVLPIVPFGILGCFPLALAARLRVPYLAMAVGPFMLFRREAYQHVGGHWAVQSEIAEDVVLARQVRRAGGRVALLDGSEQVDVHFYRGFWESWHGLAKSAFAALEYRLIPTLLMMGLYGFLFLWPVVVLVMGLWQGRGGEAQVQLALLISLLNSGLWYAVAVHFDLSRSTALFYPLTISLTILIMSDSIRRAAFSGIGWKERVYRLNGGSLRH
jgi:chlorobactene glucosyltransferase